MQRWISNTGAGQSSAGGSGGKQQIKQQLNKQGMDELKRDVNSREVETGPGFDVGSNSSVIGGNVSRMKMFGENKDFARDFKETNQTGQSANLNSIQSDKSDIFTGSGSLADSTVRKSSAESSYDMDPKSFNLEAEQPSTFAEQTKAEMADRTVNKNPSAGGIPFSMGPPMTATPTGDTANMSDISYRNSPKSEGDELEMDVAAEGLNADHVNASMSSSSMSSKQSFSSDRVISDDTRDMAESFAPRDDSHQSLRDQQQFTGERSDLNESHIQYQTRVELSLLSS